MNLNPSKFSLLIIAIFVTVGCAPQQYKFVVDSPPKYTCSNPIKTMEVMPFQSNNSRYGQQFSDLVKSGVANEGYISVVPKNAESTLTGLIEVGRIYNDSRTESYECTYYKNKKAYKKTCYTYYYTKKNSIKVNYNLHENREKNILYGDSYAEDFDKTWSSSESRSAAKVQALTDEQLIYNSMKKLAQKVVSDITPHKETVVRELQKGNSENVKLGITYLENGRIDQAIAIWDQVIENTTNPKDKAAAYYNIGVIKESQCYYKDAFELYSKANSILPAEKLYIKAMTRTEMSQHREEEMRSWKK